MPLAPNPEAHAMTPPPSLAIPMALDRALVINGHMVAWYIHATIQGIVEETPPALTYSLAEMVEAAALVREQRDRQSLMRRPQVGYPAPSVVQVETAHVVLDDRAIAALYVIHHFPHSANDSDGEPLLSFPAPNGDGIRALLFLEFKRNSTAP